MRRVQIFSGNSHPALTAAICERLGARPAKCELTKFSNGETSVSIGTSIRDQDVFIVQSGSRRTNDSVMELLIMISACKGGSARSITGAYSFKAQLLSVLSPVEEEIASGRDYCPYVEEPIRFCLADGYVATGVLANLLTVAGVQHVITVDLHAPPMRGFFSKPVDNLHAEPLIARWIQHNIPDWREGVVVSKNAGGSKRVTSLADTLKLSFGIITTDRRRSPVESYAEQDSAIGFDGLASGREANHHEDRSLAPLAEHDEPSSSTPASSSPYPHHGSNNHYPSHTSSPSTANGGFPHGPSIGHHQNRSEHLSSLSSLHLARGHPMSPHAGEDHTQFSTATDDDELEEYNDERAREVITGRLVHGHIVDDDFPSPVLSTMSGSIHFPRDSIGLPQLEDSIDPMAASFMSTTSSAVAGAASDHPLGGTYDAGAHSDDEEAQDLKDPEVERTVTLVGNVNEKPVFIIDDILDGPESWIAAAETVVKRGNARKVYCIATHPLLGQDALEQMESCDCIDFVVVCNTFPIEPERAQKATKLIVLDLSSLLAEAIRRTHHGESMSQLYQQYRD